MKPALPQRELPPMRDLDPRVLSPRYVRPGAWRRPAIPGYQPTATIADYPLPATIAPRPKPRRSASKLDRAKVLTHVNNAPRKPRVAVARPPRNVPAGCIYQAEAVRKYAHIGGAVIRSAVHNAASAVGRLTPGQRLLAKAFRKVGERIYLKESALVDWLEWRLTGPHSGVSADDAVTALPSIGMTAQSLTRIARRAIKRGEPHLLAASVICSPPESLGYRFDLEKLRVWVEASRL